jgi:hypothetical protein
MIINPDTVSIPQVKYGSKFRSKIVSNLTFVIVYSIITVRSLCGSENINGKSTLRKQRRVLRGD